MLLVSINFLKLRVFRCLTKKARKLLLAKRSARAQSLTRQGLPTECNRVENGSLTGYCAFSLTRQCLFSALIGARLSCSQLTA